MRTKTVSRRTVFGAGVCALTATAALPRFKSAHAEAILNPQSDDTIRKYYAAWKKTDWHPFDVLLTDDFTFTSANNDDHISKGAFKTQCWESQKDFIEGSTYSGYSDGAMRRL